MHDAIIATRPKVAFKINAAETAYVDTTGRSIAISSTPPILNTGLVLGSKKSAVVSSNTTHTFGPSVFIRGQESRGFTLQSAIWNMDTVSSPISVMSHITSEDGLIVKNNKISFSIEFNTIGSVTVEYPIVLTNGPVVAHGVYHPSKIEIYINGRIHEEKEITSAQILDGFKTRANDNLYIGQGAAGKKISLDAIAVHARSLTASEILFHYQSAVQDYSHDEVASLSGANLIFAGEENSRNLINRIAWNNDWSTDGLHQDTGQIESRLVPQVDSVSSLSKAGIWYGFMGVQSQPTMYGAVIRWKGVGAFVVDFSIDGGSTWTPATSDVICPGSYNVATSSIVFVVRVRFTGGIVDDTSYLSYIEVESYIDANIYTSDANKNISSSQSASVILRPGRESSQDYRSGLVISDATAHTLLKDTVSADPNTFTSLEFWVRFESEINNQYVYDARTAIPNAFIWTASGFFAWSVGTVYINGVAATTGVVPFSKNNWYHIVHVLPAAYNEPVVIGTRVAATIQYAILATYPSAISATQVQRIFDIHQVKTRVRVVTEANPVNDSSTPYKLYQTDWSMVPAAQ